MPLLGALFAVATAHGPTATTFVRGECRDVIHPQNGALSPTDKNWGSVGASDTENNTIQHLSAIFAAAKEAGYGSPRRIR